MSHDSWRLTFAAHLRAPGKAMTMRRLARSAGYRGWQAVNLQHGLFAVRVGKAIGKRGIWLGDLVEFIGPKGRSADNISNLEWVLVMRPHFARALA